MPSGTPGKGYLSKAALRIIGYNSGAYAYPTALGTPTPQTLGAYDQIPFISESVQEKLAWLDDATLDGTAGRSKLDNISNIGGGSIDLRGGYYGIGPIIAAAMGYERVRDATSIAESPTVTTSDSGTASAGAASTLTDSSKSWTTNVYVGRFVRITTIAASPNGKIDVRRITSNTGTVLTVSPNWTTNPGSGDTYEIIRACVHTYEMSENLHSEPITNILADAWNTSAYIVRLAVMAVDKGVASWEWQACAIEELNFKLNKDGLFITAELVPFGVDRRTSSRNATSTTWSYHYHIPNNVTLDDAYLKNFRILRGDATFRLGSYSTSVSLDSSNNLGITEFELKIKNNLQVDLQTTSSGKYRVEPVRSGRREVSGSLMVPRHVATTRLSNYTDQDMLMASLVFAGPSSGSVAHGLEFWMRSLKLTKADVQVGGPQVLEEKFNFTCLQPAGTSSGMPSPSTGAANSEVIIKLSNFDPFNYFMGQHQAT